MNVEASNEAMEELTTTFRYNDAVIRNLVIRRDDSVTEESLIMKSEKEDRERKTRYQERQGADVKAEEEAVAAEADDLGDADAAEEVAEEAVEETTEAEDASAADEDAEEA